MTFTHAVPAEPPPDAGELPSEFNPPVASLYRSAWPAYPQTPLATVLETLQTSPHHTVPVLDENGRLLGVVSDGDAARALLSAPDALTRAQVRQWPLANLMHQADPLPLYLTARQAEREFDRQGRDTLPVVDENGRFRGFVSRTDLVSELARPFRPPLLGGMATPLGVYLTTGTVGGGVAWPALFLNGLCLGLITLTAALLTLPLGPAINTLPAVIRPGVEAFVQEAVPLLLLLLAVRFSPISGYHAAEHQVVHAIERGEPLTVDAVRQMPRVHPRCGTNLVAGGLIVFGGGGIVSALLGRWGDLGYMIAVLVALASWRDVGAWLQRYVTTRPATTAQIQSGIDAARDVLGRHSRNPYVAVTPLSRLWRMGFVQILIGFAASAFLLYLLSFIIPGLRPAVQYLL